MPESQDEDDSGYFPLVMTRKSKAQQSIVSDAQTLPNNGVNGSWSWKRILCASLKSFSFSACALFRFTDNEKVGRVRWKICGGTGRGDDEMCSCGLVLSCYDKVYNQSVCVCSVDMEPLILLPSSQVAHCICLSPLRPFRLSPLLSVSSVCWLSWDSWSKDLFRFFHGHVFCLDKEGIDEAASRQSQHTRRVYIKCLCWESFC